MFRVLTVAREFGSGGGRIARKIGQTLGWNLLDMALVQAIARAAKVDPELAQRYDERVDSWFHRVSRRALWHGAIEGAAGVADIQFIDSETMAALGRNLITEAHVRGNCVIVGRGAQCVLQDREDVLHVFIYAPWSERIARVRERVPSPRNIEQVIRSVDQQRADFIRMYFECNWRNPHLYHLSISSELGEDRVVRTIIAAMDKGVDNQVPPPATLDC